MKNSKLTIVAIIDAAANLKAGKLSEEVSAITDSKGKSRRLDTVLFYLSTEREREYNGEVTSEKMSLAERLKMEAFMSAKGATPNADYSVAHNSVVYEFPKAALEALTGVSYAEMKDSLSDLVGEDANVVFPAFAQEPQRVRNIEITQDVYQTLGENAKKGYSAKQAGAEGQLLTHGGQQIWRTTKLVDISSELEDIVLKHDQDLRIAKPEVTQANLGVTA